MVEPTKMKLQLYISPEAYGKLCALAIQDNKIGKYGSNTGRPKPARVVTEWLEDTLEVNKMTKAQRKMFRNAAKKFSQNTP